MWIRLKEEKGNYTKPKDDWGLWQLADADEEGGEHVLTGSGAKAKVHRAQRR